jgi:hypothetical protein
MSFVRTQSRPSYHSQKLNPSYPGAWFPPRGPDVELQVLQSCEIGLGVRRKPIIILQDRR